MKKLLIIGHTWPEPDSTAAGIRMMQLIDIFKELGYEITFASAATPTEHSIDLTNLSIHVKEIALNSDSFNQWLLKEPFDAVVYDRFMIEEQYGWRFRECCPDAINILDTEDLHFLRKAREEALKNNTDLSLELLNSAIALREIASIYRCDVSLIISEYEMNLLKTQFKIDDVLLIYLPFLFDDDVLSKATHHDVLTYNKRDHFVTIGNFIHKPNYDAVLYLKNKIWPQIRERLPQSQLHIYGAYESKKVSQLHNESQGFIIKGRADDALKTVEQYRIMLAPLRYGAGLKGKLFTAMQSGTPVVASNIACESIFKEQVGTDNPDSFVNEAIDFYTDEQVWQERQQLGFKTLKTRFSLNNFKSIFTDKITKLQEEIDQHRSLNFYGRLLQQQAFNSTKYLSKWIEEKNKE